jgi:hypothetical protein
MDKDFAALRARAKANRNKVMDQARAQYAATLVQIATLEQALRDGRATRRRSITASIQSVIPREKPFSVNEIVARLEALDSKRVWGWKSVSNHLNLLVRRRILRRLEHHHGSEPSRYARAKSNIPERPFEGVSLPKAIRIVLTKPMNETEIAIRLREEGFPTTQSNRALVGHILAELRKGFREDKNGRWSR